VAVSALAAVEKRSQAGIRPLLRVDQRIDILPGFFDEPVQPLANLAVETAQIAKLAHTNFHQLPETLHALIEAGFHAVRAGFCAIHAGICAIHASFCAIRASICLTRADFCAIHTSICKLGPNFRGCLLLRHMLQDRLDFFESKAHFFFHGLILPENRSPQ
jgi:hypothetical protein